MGKRIGVFDSGLGGLTVLKELIKEFPNESFYYFGDTKNNPYGTKMPYEIKDLSLNAFKKLEELGIKALVIACNTATVYGLDAIREATDIPVVGVIDSGVQAAIEKNGENIIVLATNATINSNIFQKKLKNFNDQISVQGIGCPKMVQLVEDGDFASDNARKIVCDYLDTSELDVDTVMLSCTHFPVLKNLVEDYFKEKNKVVNIIDPAVKTGKVLREELESRDLLTGLLERKVDFYTSGDIEALKEFGNKILDGIMEIEEVENL